MRNRNIIFTVAILASVLLSACGNLLTQVEEAVAGDYGPAYSAQEHQTRTFEALWGNLENTYIYYDTADVTWDAIHETYLGRINAGLTNEEFSALLHNLETELPTGAFGYQSRSERIEADTTDFSTFEGIGAIIGFQEEEVPHVVILDVIAGSPAEKAGLKPHDSIFEIDGSPVLLEEGLTVVNRVRGPAGSSVVLNVKTPGKPERSIEVMRGKLTSSGELEAYQVIGTQYGYILFPPFSYDGMVDDVLGSLLAFTSNQKMEGLILDLRVAAGASGNWPLAELLTLFHDGEVGEFYNSAKQTEPFTVSGQDRFSSQTVPLIILVGQNTSGFPEIMAASLQAENRAVIIGETSPGAIETTASFYLPDGARIFIQTASFRLSNGKEFGNSGIQPNITLEAGWDDVLPNADPVLDAAIEILNEKK